MRTTIFTLIIVGGLIGGTAAFGAKQPYRFIREIPIGGQGGWDFVAVDAAKRRLYLSHATKVVVVDIDQAKVVGEVADTPGVHGIAIAGDLNRGFSSNGKESKVSIFDLTTLKTIDKVPTGDSPDAIIYESGRREVYAFNARGKSVTVINAKSGAVVATIALPGKPEVAVADSSAHRVYVNIEDRNSVVAIDTERHQIAATWPSAPGESATGLAIDVQHHCLFLGCDNKMMVMMNSVSGKVLSSVPIGDHVDGAEFDPATGLAFSSNGEGTVSVAHMDSPDQLTAVQTLQTRKGARTMALDLKTHNIYLPTAKFEPLVAGEKRPKIIDGSQVLLVYGPH